LTEWIYGGMPHANKMKRRHGLRCERGFEVKLKIFERNGMLNVSVIGQTQEIISDEEIGGGVALEIREKAVRENEIHTVDFERVPVFVPKTAAVVEKMPSMEAEEEIKETARNNTLFHKLSDLRKELAKEANHPPYMVFKDKTLWEMVEKMPEDLTSFGSINGVGQAKLEKYGALFLSVINETAVA
jgi:superfamily II DNA helicase RecQ